MGKRETDTSAAQYAPTRRRALWFLAAALLTGAAVFLYTVDPAQSRLAPRCVFRLATGWSCPGCGLQRAAHALLHGRWAEAAGYNPFLLISLPYLAALLAAELMPQGARREKWRAVLEGRTAVLLYLTLYTIWGVARNLLGI